MKWMYKGVKRFQNCINGMKRFQNVLTNDDISGIDSSGCGGGAGTGGFLFRLVQRRRNEFRKKTTSKMPRVSVSFYQV